MYFSLVGRADRDEHLAVAHYYGGVAVHKSFALGLAQNHVYALGNCAFLFFQLPADVIETVGSGVFHIAELVQDAVDALLYFREEGDLRHHPFQVRIDSVLYIAEEHGHFPQGFQHGAELSE